MSLFKTNFMNLIEAFLQDHGFRVRLCNIYTSGVDFYESYKRVILCASKGNLLLCIRARSGQASNPFQGDDEQIETKLQEPALKLLSAVRALHLGVDPINCKEYQGLKATPIIIMEKSARKHPLYYYYDEKARETKEWYRKKNVVFIPWEWMKEYWNDDFEDSLLSQSYEVSVPQEYRPPKKIVDAISEIEKLLASKRLGIIKNTYINNPTLPPLVVRLMQTDQLLIFMVDEKEEDIFPKLMDFAVYYFGKKTEKFPSEVKALFFNIVTTEPNRSFLRPYTPHEDPFAEQHFDMHTIIETSILGLKTLFNIAEQEELLELQKLTTIDNFEFEALLSTSSGYWFRRVFLEAKKRVTNLYKNDKCPFCEQTNALTHELPANIRSKLRLPAEFDEENIHTVYCDPNRKGCGIGLIIIRDIYHGGVHSFYLGREQFYTSEIEKAKKKLNEIGLAILSFVTDS